MDIRSIFPAALPTQAKPSSTKCPVCDLELGSARKGGAFTNAEINAHVDSCLLEANGS